jgi:hypothetical protein
MQPQFQTQPGQEYQQQLQPQPPAPRQPTLQHPQHPQRLPNHQLGFQNQPPQFQQQQQQGFPNQAPQFQQDSSFQQQQQHSQGAMQQQQRFMQQTQHQYGQVNGGGQQIPQVETVADEGVGSMPASMLAGGQVPQQPQYRPETTTGSGIDARTTPDPKTEAEQMAVSSGGAPGAADGRIALLQASLVNELPKFLLEGVLENPALSKVKDSAAAKVHTVELLKLLTMDPGFGMKFQLILDEIPAWKNYKSQDHSLFITGSEQKADYFLTDGSSGEPTKLLTQE